MHRRDSLQRYLHRYPIHPPDVIGLALSPLRGLVGRVRVQRLEHEALADPGDRVVQRLRQCLLPDRVALLREGELAVHLISGGNTARTDNV